MTSENHFSLSIVSKERISGHIRRKYGEPKTPYQSIMEDEKISPEIKTQLTEIYDTLNPAELKRNLVRHQDLLYRAYLQKQNQSSLQKVDYHKKLTPRLATFLIAEPIAVRQHSLVA